MEQTLIQTRKPRRRQFEVIRDILAFNSGDRVSFSLGLALNYSTVDKYINLLVEQGMLSYTRNELHKEVFEITPDGRRLLLRINSEIDLHPTGPRESLIDLIIKALGHAATPEERFLRRSELAQQKAIFDSERGQRRFTLMLDTSCGYDFARLPAQLALYQDQAKLICETIDFIMNTNKRMARL